MRHLLGAIVLLGCGGVCQATTPDEYNTCMEYAYTNYNAKAPFNCGLTATSNGWVIAPWNIPAPKPTLAQLEAVKAQALAWKSNQVAETTANIQGMEPQLRAVIRALVKTVNQRLPSGQKITEEELKAAIRDEAGK